MLYQENLDRLPYFESKMVNSLLAKMKKSAGNTSARDDMALVLIASLQLLHRHFIDENAQEKFEGKS